MTNLRSEEPGQPLDHGNGDKADEGQSARLFADVRCLITRSMPVDRLPFYATALRPPVPCCALPDPASSNHPRSPAA